MKYKSNKEEPQTIEASIIEVVQDVENVLDAPKECPKKRQKETIKQALEAEINLCKITLDSIMQIVSAITDNCDEGNY